LFGERFRAVQTMLNGSRHSVGKRLQSAIAPFIRLSHCGSLQTTWVCPRLKTRKGNALNTTPWTKSQTNNLISYIISTRFDAFQSRAYSTLTMPKRKSTAAEVAVVEARPRRSLRNAQPASEPEPVAASTPAAKELKKVQPKSTPKAVVRKGGRKTPQKFEEESVRFFSSLDGRAFLDKRHVSSPCDIDT